MQQGRLSVTILPAQLASHSHFLFELPAQLLLVCLFWFSNISAPEVGGVLVVGEVLMTCHHLDVLVSVGICDQLPLNSSVFVLALTAGQMPCVSNHELEVVVLVNAGTHILVVVDELFSSHFVIAGLSIPLGHELAEDVITAHFTGLELGVLADIVSLTNVVKVDKTATIPVKFIVCQLYEANSALVHLAADTPQELIIADPAIVVLVKVLENALKFRGAKGVTILAETPHELVAVHLAVTVVVHTAEDDAEATDAMTSTLLQHSKYLL